MSPSGSALDVLLVKILPDSIYNGCDVYLMCHMMYFNSLSRHSKAQILTHVESFFYCKYYTWASTRETLSSGVYEQQIRADWSAPLLFALSKVSYLYLLQAKFQVSS